ncbi:hypothetical protein B0H14DRAFT_2792191 [Mycena olivaceomarginata]|nr:hypothetical protein B0H14DRAFT_2792191 [Mycena olivaceomarginata]
MLALFRDEAAPHLQHLEIVCATLDETPLVMFSSGVPRLDFLKIDGFILQSPAAAFKLTHLELRRDRCIDPLDVNYADYLLTVVDIFDAPALTELIFDGAHGDQIASLLGRKTLPLSIFPALTSLTFLLGGLVSVRERERKPSLSHYLLSSGYFPRTVSSHPDHQCFTEHLIQDMLGLASHPLAASQNHHTGCGDDSFEKMDSKRQRGEPVPEVQTFTITVS